jgi:hypothetical protein
MDKPATATGITRLMPNVEVDAALSVLREDFPEAAKTGPMRAARFAGAEESADLREDVVGFTAALRTALDLRSQ